MTTGKECSSCGASLDEEELSQGRCNNCGAELSSEDEGRARTAEELSEEAAEESFPASDPPAW